MPNSQAMPTAEVHVGLTRLQNLCAGWAAAGIARSVTSPLDYAKLQMQICGKHDLIGVMAFTYRRDGLLGFFKGNTVACLRIPVYSYSAWYASIYLKKLIAPSSPVGNWTVGMSGGLVATTIAFALDTIKTRMTLRKANTKTCLCPFCFVADCFRDIADCFVEIFTKEGLRAFFQGLCAALAAHICQAATRAVVIAALRMLLTTNGELSEVQAFVSGVISAAVSETVWFPLDTIRRVRQAQHSKRYKADQDSTDIRAASTVPCAVEIIDKRGILGLWAGSSANLLKLVPYNLCNIACYEALVKFFIERNVAAQHKP